MPRDGTSTRERIVAEAGRLFEERGFSQVSLEDVARSAGITKRGLLYHFSKKDDLAAACAMAQAPTLLRRLQDWAADADPEATAGTRLQRLMLRLGDWVDGGHWTDLGFIRFSAELGVMPHHPARRLASQAKKQVEGWIEGLLAGSGHDPADARLVTAVIDGALVQALVHRDGSYARDCARLIARLLPERGAPRGLEPALAAGAADQMERQTIGSAGDWTPT